MDAAAPDDLARDPLISTRELGELLEHDVDDPPVVLDCTVHLLPADGGGFRIVSGRADFEQGHIPTARFADLTGPLVDTDSPLRFALGTPEQFCDAMGELGVGDDSTVVLYDAAGSMWAARVWWMLRWVGFDRALVLDGGWRAWTEEDRPVSTGGDEFAAAQLPPADEDAIAAPAVSADPEPHEVLGVAPDAPEPVVIGAFRELVKEGHADGGGAEEFDVDEIRKARDAMLDG